MSTSLTTRSTKLLAPQLDYLLVDGSSSMRDKWRQTLGALENFKSVLLAGGAHCHAILTVFDSYNIQSVQKDGVLADWSSILEDPPLASWGSTPLFDAINVMGRHLRDLAPSRASIVIATDGEELGSKYTSAAQAKAILDWCRAQDWQVTFLGADFDNWSQAKLLGADASNSFGVRKELLEAAGTLIGKKRMEHYHSGKGIGFSTEEKLEFGGYLSHD